MSVWFWLRRDEQCLGYDEEAKTMKGVKISNNRNTKWEKNWKFFKIFLYLGFSSWHLLSINEKSEGKNQLDSNFCVQNWF